MTFTAEMGRGYAVLQILLVLAFVLLKALRRANSRRNYFSASALLKIATASFFSVLVIPVGLGILPSPQLPQFDFRVVNPPRETAAELSANVSRRFLGSPGPPSIPNPPPIGGRRFTEGRVLAWVSRRLLAVFFLAFVLRFVFARRYLARYLRQGISWRRLGRVRIVIVDGLNVPFSAWLGKMAWIALPPSFLACPGDLRVAVLHEAQHHRNGDPRLTLFLEILTLFLFPNPFFFLWRKELTELQEFSCDEVLIGRKRLSPLDYGTCLVKVAELSLRNRCQLVGTSSMAGGSGILNNKPSFLTRRVEMLFWPKKFRATSIAVRLWGTALVMVLVLTACVAQQNLTRQDSPAEENSRDAASFDPAVQGIAQAALNKSLAKWQAKTGLVVVQEPTTGRVLAVATGPNPDGANQDSRWGLSRLVEPASIMKAIVAASVLDRNLATVNDQFNCENGSYSWEGTEYRDWRKFKTLSLQDTVVQSSNICGIKIAQRLTAPELTAAVENFGVGPNGVTQNFPGSRPGILASAQTLNPSQFVAMVGTGYSGVHLSALEIVSAFSAIANGGNLMRPLSAEKGAAAAEVLRRVMRPETSRAMTEVLAKVMTEGTAKNAASRQYKFAGKTGTSYEPNSQEPDKQGGEPNVASFVGFGPVGAPKLAIYVSIFSPAGQAHGSTQAAPLFTEVAEKVLNLSVASVNR